MEYSKEAPVIKDLFNGNVPSLFLFDMDHTLINNDCDVSWKQFLVEKGAAPKSSLERAQHYYDDYVRGELDVAEFLRFQLEEFRGRSYEEMRELAQIHFEEVVKDRVYPFFRELLNELSELNIPRAIVTATNEVIAEPVAKYLKIPAVLATKLAQEEHLFTGELLGDYCYSENKVGAAELFVSQHSLSLDDSAYFGDSLSDVPLLKRVNYPVLINPGKAVANRFKVGEVNILHL